MSSSLLLSANFLRRHRIAQVLLLDAFQASLLAINHAKGMQTSIYDLSSSFAYRQPEAPPGNEFVSQEALDQYSILPQLLQAKVCHLSALLPWLHSIQVTS